MIFQAFEEKYKAIAYKTRQQIAEEMRMAQNNSVFPFKTGMTFSDVKISLVNTDAKLAEEIGKATKDFQASYTKETEEVNELFRKALAKEYLGDENHPKEAKVWNRAWVDSHSDGYQSIESTYSDLADLFN